MGSAKGYLYELFTSIQGEGLWAGGVHHFLRLAGCGSGCRYCDTAWARERPARYRISGREEGDNPVDAAKAAALVAQLDRIHPRAQVLAVTGGEPLEQALFLQDFLPRVKKEVLGGRPILLETNGLLPRAMAEVAPLVDMVSMDVKLDSTSGLGPVLEIHRAFLDSLEGTRFYVKMVVCAKTSREEVTQGALLSAKADPKAPLFLQPESGAGEAGKGAGYLLDLWEAARETVEDVRVLPQMHRILGVE